MNLGAENHQPLRGAHVLVVDDAPEIREVTQAWLEEVGAIVETQPDGEKALEAVSRASFDFVIMDIEMPRMNGWEATTVLRARGYQNPILAYTSQAETTNRGGWKDAGFTAFFPKTLRVEEFLDRLAETVGLKPIPLIEVDRMAKSSARILAIFRKFSNGLGKEIDLLEEQVALRDREKVLSTLHRLKGAAGNCGFEAVHRRLADAESCVADNSQEWARTDWVAQLKSLALQSRDEFNRLHPTDQEPE